MTSATLAINTFNLKRFALSTQAVEFFRRKAGYELGEADRLPAERREKLERSGRKSKVLMKALDAVPDSAAVTH